MLKEAVFQFACVLFLVYLCMRLKVNLHVD